MSNILVVDDSNVIRTELRNLLEPEGHTITEADTGQAGLDLLNKTDAAFELVITDLNMPVMDGLEMIAQISAQENKSFSGPIIMLTTEFSQEYRERGKQLGVKLWLTKPIDKTTLLPAVDKLKRA